MVYISRTALAAFSLLIALVGLTSCGGAATGTPARNASTRTPLSLTPTPDASREHSPSGDVPDSATYLVYRSSHYTLQYVEGWVRQGLPNDGVQFADKDSFVTVTLQSLPSGSVDEYARGPGTTQSAQEFKQFTNAQVTSDSLPAGSAVLLSFQALAAPDPVTGKSVMLALDRYYIPGQHLLAVLTLATPLGVDNVDAFRQIAKSFAWSGQ